MPFTMPNYRALSLNESSPFMGALQNILQGYGQGVQLKYLPRQQEAEIFHKTIGPLANIAVSPLAMAMNPTQQNQIMDMISRMLSQGSAMPGAQQGGGLFGGNNQAAANAGQLGQGAQEGAQPQGNMITSGGNPALLPGANQGVSGSARANIQSGFTKSPFEPGQVAQNPTTGEIISTPSASTVSGLQQVNSAIKNVTPILKQIPDLAKPFLEKGGTLTKYRSQAAGELHKLGVPENLTAIVGNKKLANQYAQFEANIDKATESLANSLGLSGNIPALETVKSILTPKVGEDYTGYSQRINDDLQSLAQRYAQNTQTLGSGYNLNQQNLDVSSVNQPNYQPERPVKKPVFARNVDEYNNGFAAKSKVEDKGNSYILLGDGWHMVKNKG